MKTKIFKVAVLSAIFSICSMNVISQVYQLPNGGFENWDENGEPSNWNGFVTANCGLTGFAALGCSTVKTKRHEVSTEVRPDADTTINKKSCKIFATEAFSVIANGNITTGQINVGSTTASNASNYNVTLINNSDHNQKLDAKPDSISFWVKFDCPDVNQYARMNAVIHDEFSYKDPSTAEDLLHRVGYATKEFTSCEWKKYTVPFVYEGGNKTSKYILLTFTTNKEAGEGSKDDKLYIDDISFIYDTKLSELKSDGALIDGFLSSTLDYYDTLNYGEEKPTITAKPASSNANYTIENVNEKLTKVIVTSGDATTTYTIHYAYKPSCPGDTNLTVVENITLEGALPVGGVYSGLNVENNASVYTFNTANVEDGIYTITYTTDGGFCSYKLVVNIPVVLDSIVPANDVTVCSGTPENNAIEALADSAVVITNKGEKHNVELNWVISNYDENTTGSYIAKGSFTLPEGIGVANSEVKLEVSANVIVSENLDVEISGNDVICSGLNTELTVSGADTYLWNTGAVSESIIVNPTVNTTYSVVGSSGICTGSASIAVVVNENPNVIISGNLEIAAGESTTLVASGADSYLWSNEAVTSEIIVNKDTTYWVIGTDAKGCKDSVAVIVTIVNGIDEVEVDCNMYPNPANNNLYIVSSEMINNVEIVSISGQLVFSAMVERSKAIIDIQKMIEGIYFVRIYTNKGLSTKKLTIER